MGFFSFGKKKNQTKRNNATKLANNTRKRNNLARRNAAIRAMNRASLSANQQQLYNQYMEYNQAKKNLETSYKQVDDIIKTIDEWIYVFRDPKMLGLKKNYKNNDPSTWPYYIVDAETQKKYRKAVYDLLLALGEPDYRGYDRNLSGESVRERETAQRSIKGYLQTAKDNQLRERRKLQEGLKYANGSQMSEGLNQEVTRKLMNTAAQLAP